MGYEMIVTPAILRVAQVTNENASQILYDLVRGFCSQCYAGEAMLGEGVEIGFQKFHGSEWSVAQVGDFIVLDPLRAEVFVVKAKDMELSLGLSKFPETS